MFTEVSTPSSEFLPSSRHVLTHLPITHPGGLGDILEMGNGVLFFFFFFF